MSLVRPSHTGELEWEECHRWLSGTGKTFVDEVLNVRDMHPGGFTSQHRQDRVLWERVFSRNRGVFSERRGGHVYLDVASNHWKRISNTYFFDRCLGWSGVCVEPNPRFHAGLRANRSCAVVPKCVSDRETRIRMVLPHDEWASVASGVDSKQLPAKFHRWSKGLAPAQRAFTSEDVSCSALDNILRELQLTHVDLMSLDVENHEGPALRGLNLTRTIVDVLLCEGHGCVAHMSKMHCHEGRRRRHHHCRRRRGLH